MTNPLVEKALEAARELDAKWQVAWRTVLPGQHEMIFERMTAAALLRFLANNCSTLHSTEQRYLAEGLEK